MSKKKGRKKFNKNIRKFIVIAILGLVFVLSFFMFYLSEERGITGGVSVNVEEVITPAGSGNVMLNEFFEYKVNISCSGEDCGEINVTLAPRIIPEEFEMDQQLGNIGPSFIGEVVADYSGKSVSGVGDVNNDGFDDFIIGANGNDEGGNYAGQVYLIFGQSNGWEMDFNLTSANASFIGEATGVKCGEYTSGAGDVNNDSYDDFLIGVYYDDGGGNNIGQTYLILGRADGWEMDVNLSNVNASFIGEVAGDYSGKGVSGVGDVNNDGFDDFIITSSNNNEGADFAGQSYLILGRADGWERGVSLSNANASFIGEIKYDYTGKHVSGAGDVNNDGFDDFIISSEANDEGGSNTGQTYLILGKADGWEMDVNLSNVNASFIGEVAGDYSGYSVSSAGDVNNDGFDDFIIGTAGNNDEGGEDSGQTYLILGKANGWEMDVNLSSADASFIGEVAGDYSGQAVSGVGDVNNDGFDDFIIGSRKNAEGGEDSGQTYLILGKANGWEMDVNLSSADASFIGEANGDYAGEPVSGAGDVNNDGFDDFLISAFTNSEGGSVVGQVYLIFDSEGIGIIPTSDIGFSFYTNATSNPQTINLSDGEFETVTFWINATAGVGRTYEFFVSANKTSNPTDGSFSERINLTIISNEPEVNLVSPSNATSNNTQTYNFTCNMTDDWSLGNVSLVVWNSFGSLIHTSASEDLTTGIWDIYNKSATITFEYFLPYSDNFNWNCLVYDEAGNSSFANENYTITVETFPEMIIEWIIPTTHFNISKNNFAFFSFNVSCSELDCGALNVSLDPLFSSGLVDSVSFYNDGMSDPYSTVGTEEYYESWDYGVYKYVGFTNGSAEGTCYSSTYFYWEGEGTLYFENDEGYLFGILEIGDSYQIWDTQQECLNSFETTKEGLVSTSSSNSNYWTNSSNPKTINLNVGEFQIVSWWVNATGDLDATNEFSAYVSRLLDINQNDTTEFFNITIVSDADAPSMTINSPTTSITDASVTFSVTATDATSIDSCWYSINSGETNTTLTNSSTLYTGSETLSDGSYTALFWCNDSYNNLNSESVSFTISSEEEEKSTGSVAISRASPTANTTVYYAHQLGREFSEQGETFNLRINRAIGFKHKQENHTLILKNFNISFVTITINSELITAILEKGVATSFDIDGDSLEDIEVTYKGIVNSEAQIFIKNIFTSTGDAVSSGVVSDEDIDTEIPKTRGNIIKIVLVIVLSLGIIAVMVILILKARKNKEPNVQ